MEIEQQDVAVEKGPPPRWNSKPPPPPPLELAPSGESPFRFGGAWN